MRDKAPFHLILLLSIAVVKFNAVLPLRLYTLAPSGSKNLE